MIQFISSEIGEFTYSYSRHIFIIITNAAFGPIDPNVSAEWVVEQGTAEDADACRQRCTDYNGGNFVCASDGAELVNGKHIYTCSHEDSDAPPGQCYYSKDHDDEPPYNGFCSYYIDEDYALSVGLVGPFTTQEEDAEPEPYIGTYTLTLDAQDLIMVALALTLLVNLAVFVYRRCGSKVMKVGGKVHAYQADTDTEA